MSPFNRRTAIKGALASAAVPALISGCISLPTAAAMGKAAPYAPDTLSQSGGAADSPDAKLLDLCAQFHRLTEADAAAWERYCSMPEDSPEAKALSLEFDGRYDAWAAVSDTCYATPPRTPAGAAALLDVILSRDAEFIDAAAQKPLRLVRDSLQAMAMS